MRASVDRGKIREHWDARAKQFGIHPRATFNDLYLREMEIRNLWGFLDHDCLILDAGCGNGYATVRFAEGFRSQFVGIDYSEEMIRCANELKQRKGLSNVRFCVADFESLPFRSGLFDIVVTIRSLTNPPTWESQVRAISELIRSLRPGGLLLMSEPSQQGLAGLNRVRRVFGLYELGSPWYNLYLDDEKLLEEFRGKLSLVEIRPYASTYYFGSRVIYPFILGKRREPKYDSFLNRLFCRLPSVGRFGTQRLYVFTKVAS